MHTNHCIFFYTYYNKDLNTPSLPDLYTYFDEGVNMKHESLRPTDYKLIDARNRVRPTTRKQISSSVTDTSDYQEIRNIFITQQGIKCYRFLYRLLKDCH